MSFASAFKQAGIPKAELERILGREVGNCGNCKWHADFTGVCCNGDSEHCADFTDNSEVCDCHEDLEDREDE